uniref:Uncharacterized protein n=1 Tax=Ananas comosus var. bracteatus TaxID=296719 RepID=A0A6V7PHT5_ANACO|nr:unnamed protein product [Ananas comosus var. bracteatus]
MSSGDPIDHLGPRNVLHLPRPLFNLLLRSNFEDLSDFEVIASSPSPSLRFVRETVADSSMPEGGVAKSHVRGLNAYDRHKKFMKDYGDHCRSVGRGERFRGAEAVRDPEEQIAEASSQSANSNFELGRENNTSDWRQKAYSKLGKCPHRSDSLWRLPYFSLDR